jgi:hypothetical protein
MALQGLYVFGAARLAADAINSNEEPRQSQRNEQVICQFYHFGIQGRVSIPYGFDTELVVLAIAPSLWALISEGRANVVQPYRLG